MTDESARGADGPLPLPNLSLADRVIGAVLGRLIKGGPSPEELSKAVRASRVPPPRAQEPGVLRCYLPEPGQAPPPAEVDTDPDLAERLPRLLDQEWVGVPPEFQRHFRGERTFRLHAVLEEDGEAVVVRAYKERIGTLKTADAEVYAAHLRSARLNDQLALVLVRGSLAGRRPSRVTVNFRQVATDEGAQPG
jgi:hypothetical protein